LRVLLLLLMTEMKHYLMLVCLQRYIFLFNLINSDIDISLFSTVHSRVLYRGERCERDGTNTSLSVPSHYLWPFTIGEKSFVALTIGEKSANMEMLIGNKKIRF
jgi:hypothetical protein